VLQLVVDRIVVEESRVVIQHVVPTGAVRLQPEQLGQKTPLSYPQLSATKEMTSSIRTDFAQPSHLAQDDTFA